jgi:Glycosyltransferase family 10 (fucosyltransferase) C-term
MSAFAPGEQSYINVNDFSSAKALADELIALASDNIAYERYHQWRKRPLRDEFLSWLAPQAISPQARLVSVVIEHLQRRQL